MKTLGTHPKAGVSGMQHERRMGALEVVVEEADDLKSPRGIKPEQQ
jgi:hypothetical protein